MHLEQKIYCKCTFDLVHLAFLPEHCFCKIKLALMFCIYVYAWQLTCRNLFNVHEIMLNCWITRYCQISYWLNMIHYSNTWCSANNKLITCRTTIKQWLITCITEERIGKLIECSMQSKQQPHKEHGTLKGNLLPC